MNDAPSIDLAVPGKFQAFSLASEFARLGRLRDLYAIHRTLTPPEHVPWRAYHNRFDLAVWGHLSRFVSLGFNHQRKAEIFEDWVTERAGRKTPGVLHAWNGACNNTFRKLKGSGWRLCVERSCPHNQFQYDLLVEEGRALGIPHREDLRALERAIEELYLADVIVAPSSYSAGSYTDPELIRKVRVNPLGANLTYREKRPNTGGLKVLMVGNAFLRKGTHYLIEAFKFITSPDAELWIRGDVPDDYRQRIKDPRITIIPPVLPYRLSKLYEAADVFVQPSIDEGFGMTTLEALAFGLPLVITENVGAKDVLSPAVAVTVPIRNAEAIAEAIETARRMGGAEFDAARKALIETNTWMACAQRMLAEVYV